MSKEKFSNQENQADNLRTEYTALSSFFNTLIGFRLTLLGFYLAAIGLLASSTWPLPVPIGILGIMLTIPLYLFELRTRTLFYHLAERAVEIEQLNWEFKTQKDIHPFYSREFPNYLKQYNENVKDAYYIVRIKIFGIIPISSRAISHSIALDLLYVGVLVFFIVSIFITINMPPSTTTINTTIATATPLPTQTAVP